jgi:hypothetical protein
MKYQEKSGKAPVTETSKLLYRDRNGTLGINSWKHDDDDDDDDDDGEDDDDGI